MALIKAIKGCASYRINIKTKREKKTHPQKADLLSISYSKFLSLYMQLNTLNN